jgi:predicted O-linked N-acetylglucosamine transferase (SPINDLY family)
LQKHYAEKILYLPHCYLPRDTSVLPSPITPKRSNFGLPEEGFVFCSFNHDYKINPLLFKVWMDLLREVPGSVLWLMKLNESAQANLTKEAIKNELDPARLVYATRLPSVEDHLSRYRLADVFLDTFPYNGHTTCSDALLSGLPVVTFAGSSFSSRVAGSLLFDLALTELATGSTMEYKEKALCIATNAELRGQIQATLTNKLNANEWPVKPAHQIVAFMNTLE